MNKLILIGNLTSDPILNYSKEKSIPYCKATLAIDDRIGKTTHFIPFIIFNKGAESLCQYAKKGSKIGINGYITRTSYQKDNEVKKYNTEVVAESFEFINNKKRSSLDTSNFKLVSNDSIPF